MNKFILFLNRNIRLLLGATVILLLLIIIAVAIINKGSVGQTSVEIANQKFNIEVAKTDQEKQVGLSKTEVLGENDGMLFVFDEPDYYSFWMRNMKFPIDILFINGDKVNTIIENASPSADSSSLEIYKPKEKSDKVFEINAGTVKKYNIKEGSTININNL